MPTYTTTAQALALFNFKLSAFSEATMAEKQSHKSIKQSRAMQQAQKHGLRRNT
jgi:hypothetical protein